MYRGIVIALLKDHNYINEYSATELDLAEEDLLYGYCVEDNLFFEDLLKDIELSIKNNF